MQIEKTALETKSEIVPTERVMTTDDIMLMLVVADRNTPLPKKIRLNTFGAPTEFSIDDNFFANKELMMQNAKAAMPTTVPVHLRIIYSTPFRVRPIWHEILGCTSIKEDHNEVIWLSISFFP